MERRARERVSRYTLLYSHVRVMRARRKNEERIKRMRIAGEKDKWREDLL